MWLSRLRTMKAESGKTTKQIAELSKVPEPTLEKLFAGVTKDPKLETVWAVVKALGYTLDDLDVEQSAKKDQGAEEHPGQKISVDRLATLLEDAGYITPGQDLTDSDFKYLASVAVSLQLWFSK